jgi:hypothetical protein
VTEEEVMDPDPSLPVEPVSGWRDDDSDAQGPEFSPTPAVMVAIGTARLARVDDKTWTRVEGLVRAAATGDRTEIERTMNQALELNRSRRIGVKYALRAGLWCVMTSTLRRAVDVDDLWPIADSVSEGVSRVVTLPEVEVMRVLASARILSNGPEGISGARYPLPEALYTLLAAVTLAQLMRFSPAPGNDISAIATFAERHCASRRPADVEAEWLASLNA